MILLYRATIQLNSCTGGFVNFVAYVITVQPDYVDMIGEEKGLFVTQVTEKPALDNEKQYSGPTCVKSYK